MIDQQLLNMIDDPDPQVRSQAVKQLAKTKSQEAVQYLAAIYKTDDDPEIRELARKAGLYIKKKQREEQWTGGDPDPDAYDEPEDVPEEINVSPRAVESSKGLMDSAMNLHVAGDDDKAGEYVEKAFLANPNLQHDSYYLGLASTILGIPGDQVVEMILGDVEFSSSGKAKRKRKNIEGDVSTEKVMVDLLIYFVVVAALVIVGMLILISLLNSAVESPEFSAAMSSGEFDASGQQVFVDIVNGFIQGGFVISLVSGIVMGIYSVIVLVVQLGCMHVVATMMLGGVGTFKQLLHKITGMITGFTVIYVVVMMLAIYMTFDGIIRQDMGMVGNANNLQFLMSIGSFIYFAWFVSSLGKVYEFGTGASCGTIFIGSILFAIAVGIISAAMSAGLLPLFFGLMGGAPTGF